MTQAQKKVRPRTLPGNAAIRENYKKKKQFTALHENISLYSLITHTIFRQTFKNVDERVKNSMTLSNCAGHFKTSLHALSRK